MTSPIQLQQVVLPGRWRDSSFHLGTFSGGEGPAVVFCHGFPDLARGWRHQLQATADAGYRILAPDMRGYGNSSCPPEVEAYTLEELTGDLVALLDAHDIDKAVFVGHDWGGFVTWAMPVLHPDRVLGVAAACTPYMPFPSVATHLEAVQGDVERQYVAWFQQPGIAESYMDQHVATIVDKIMRTSVPLDELLDTVIVDGKLNMNPFFNLDELQVLGQPLLSREDFAHYVDSFSNSGYRGGINWYRNIDRNAREHPEVGVQPLDIPCLMIMAELDPALPPEFAADMPERCSNLEMQLVANAGHWVQCEQPAAFNQHLLGWLTRHFPASSN